MKHDQGTRPELHENFSPEIISVSPAEQLLDVEHADEIWPKEIAKDQTFLEQVEARKKLNQRLDTVLSALPRPDITLEQTVADGQLTEDQVADLYESLSDLLAPESEYQRILLYLPFEFLPSTTWEPTSERLKNAAQTFRTNYLHAWEQQLVIHDVRANFVDGDVLEVEKRTGDLPRVVKAAHLIPKLVEAGLLSVDEVLARMNETHDDFLRQSIADTLPVLKDLRLLEGHDAREEKTDEEKEEDVDDKDATENRKAWLRQEKKRKAIVKASDEIQKAIESGIFKLLDLETLDVNEKQAFVEGVRKAAEARAHIDKKQGRTLLETYVAQLESLWNSDVPKLRESLSKLFFRLHGLGVINHEELNSYGLTMPALAGPFSENLKGMEAELEEIKRTVSEIERDPNISKLIFPVVLLFGSRLKGYGSVQSDIDVAIFIKPNVQESDKASLRPLLSKLFGHEKIGGQVTEFWTQEDGPSLRIIDPKSFDPSMGESFWTYILFGAIWQGKPEAIAELREKILPPYFYDDGKIVYNRNARGLGLEELERDTLQYRLMHKGYEKFHPSYGGMKTPHADWVDGASLFWDSGYRQTATKLYASRVFLPKLEQPV